MAPMIKIKLAVDRSRNLVLFADAGSDFVDVLLTFLTLPLSALQFCQAAASLPGCISNLCDSVSRLRESKLLKVDACHGMLLTPSHEHEFWPESWDSYDTFANRQSNLLVNGSCCECWLVLARLVYVYKIATSGSATFVRPKERFVISDDWTIKPASTSILQSLPCMLSSDAIFHGFEEVEVCVGWAEVVSMLKASLSSDTIFTDVFLPKKETEDSAARVTVKVKPSARQKILHQPDKDSGSAYSLPEIKIKLFYDRKEKKVMYAECKRELVDLLLGFLTYPLGCVIKDKGTRAAPIKKSPKRQCTAVTVCHLGSSFDNLYSSASGLGAAGFITGEYPVQKLLNPSLSPFRRWWCDLPTDVNHDDFCLTLAPYGGMSKKTCSGCHPDLVKDRSYIVDDDLHAHQASAMSVAKHWYMRNKANVVETDVTVGKPEAVALLRAMLTSKTALTEVFIGGLEEPPAATIL